MSARRKAIAAGLGGAATLTAGWVATQRADRRAIEADPKGEALFAEFGGERQVVRTVDGTALWVRSFGPVDAPTIVFVHGWTCAAEFWKLQVEALKGERRLITFDLRGHGQSERSRDRDYTIETFARDLDSVLEYCVPTGERAMLVGHSLGAMSIVAWAGEHPEKVEERVASAVLVNTGIGDLISESLVVEGLPSGFGAVERFAGELVLRARAPIPTFSAPISSRVIRYATMGPDATPAQVAFCEQLILSCPADVRGAVGGTLTRLDLRHALEHLTAPTLVIAGERDRLTPPKHALDLANDLPDVLDLIVIPRSGHMSPIEFPDEVNGPIAELAGAPLAASVA